jgi:hypothetical protein
MIWPLKMDGIGYLTPVLKTKRANLNGHIAYTKTYPMDGKNSQSQYSTKLIPPLLL